MRAILCAALAAASLITANTAGAQVFKGYEQRAVFDDHAGAPPRLPIGFHDFEPMPSEAAGRKVSSDGKALCSSWRAALSLGKRIAQGMPPELSAAAMKGAWGGNSPCGFSAGLTLTPLAHAIRGDDGGTAIYIVKYVDQFGTEHYIGRPHHL